MRTSFCPNCFKPVILSKPRNEREREVDFEGLCEVEEIKRGCNKNLMKTKKRKAEPSSICKEDLERLFVY